jgi:hypothetical protein
MSRFRNAMLGGAVYVALDLLCAQALSQTVLWDPEVIEREYRVSVQPYHHGLASNVDMLGVWGGKRYPVRTNNLGFRDAQVRVVPLRSTSPRVVVIGDSFTEGLGVPYADTYAGLLDRYLAGRDIQLLNAGVMSYSPSIYYRKLRYLLEDVGLRFAYVVVAIDLSDIGDEARLYRMDSTDRVVSRPARESQTDTWTRIWSFANDHSLLLHVIHRVRAAAYIRRADPALYTDWTNDPRAYRDYGATGLRLALDRMDRLEALLRRHGIGLAIVVYPYPGEVLRRDSTSLQVRVWHEWATMRGVPLFNLFPAFLSYGPPSAAIRDNFIPHDVHWNARGHRLVAQTLLAEGLADTISGYLGRAHADPHSQRAVSAGPRSTRQGSALAPEARGVP